MSASGRYTPRADRFRPHHHRQGRRTCGWLRQICVQDDDWTGGICKIGGFLS
ncbi:MAG: hypothetical protein IJ150_09120 [Bacteroidales bacterium]|nr:hypothetical protein [Bacteroidales bacterium]